MKKKLKRADLDFLHKSVYTRFCLSNKNVKVCLHSFLIRVCMYVEFGISFLFKSKQKLHFILQSIKLIKNPIIKT